MRRIEKGVIKISGQRLCKKSKANYTNRFGDKVHMSRYLRLLIEVNKKKSKKRVR